MNSPSPKQNSNRKRIIVIGAGLAGLSCAYQLNKKKHDVLILEASDRIGGRIRTLREPFSDGLFAEAGAYYVSDQHKLLIKYITEEFRNSSKNIKLTPILPKDASTWYYFKKLKDPWLEITALRGLGNLVGRTRGDTWPRGLELTPEETAAGLFRFLGSYLSFENPSELWSPARFVECDEMSILEYLKARGASSASIQLLQSWFVPYLDDFGRVSALALLRDAAIGRNLPQSKEQVWSTIDRGMDQLPAAFVSALPKKAIRINSPVVELKQHDAAVMVDYVDAESGGRFTEIASHVVCAVPFSILRTIEVIPPFSAQKQKAIVELPYASIARVYVQCKERLWVKERWKGALYTDLPLMNLIDSTFHQKGTPAGILHSYMSGAQARVVQTMKPEGRIEFVLTYLEKLYPGLRKSFEAAGCRGTSICWDEEKWARGAYAYFRPGQMSSMMPHIATPEWTEASARRVHFAGDHTSSRPGWMEGALESGHRAANEIDSTISAAH